MNWPMALCSRDMIKNEEIKYHIRKHYTLFFEEMLMCPLNILKGKELARVLGYSSDLVDLIPEKEWYTFAPCGNPLPYLNPEVGDSILNLGCGGGIDSFAIYMKYCSSVTIVNLDLIYNALKKSQKLIHSIGGDFKIIHWVCADGNNLPFRFNSFDWIIMNGVFNLFPDRNSLLGEIHRILKPRGKLVVADLACTESLEEYFSQEPAAWAWCISGASTKRDLTSLLQSSGFCEIKFELDKMDNTFYRMIFSCQKS